jgi:hypothetical protein
VRFKYILNVELDETRNYICLDGLFETVIVSCIAHVFIIIPKKELANILQGQVIELRLFSNSNQVLSL